jgi:hypothetical protein
LNQSKEQANEAENKSTVRSDHSWPSPPLKEASEQGADENFTTCFQNHKVLSAGVTLIKKLNYNHKITTISASKMLANQLKK